jgi:hypothetical protein
MRLFFFIFIGVAVAQFFLPWWTMAVIAALAAFFFANGYREALLAGSLACGSCWLLYATYLTLANGMVMTGKVATMFSLPGTWPLYIITFLLAAITGGLGACTGFSAKNILRKKEVA